MTVLSGLLFHVTFPIGSRLEVARKTDLTDFNMSCRKAAEGHRLGHAGNINATRRSPITCPAVDPCGECCVSVWLELPNIANCCI